MNFPNHEGARIAVLGSGPSLLEARDADYDVGIAVNSTINTGFRFDYFQSNHAFAHTRPRWTARASELGIAVLMNSQSAPYWELLYPDPEIRENLQRSYQEFLETDGRTMMISDMGSDNGKPVNNYFKILTPSVSPHIAYDKVSISSVDKLLDQEEQIIDGASSSGAAIHMAYLMGASEIVLYGVQMTNHDGLTYAVMPSEEERGRTVDSQRKNLDRLFKELHEKGMPIFIHGDHSFRSPFLIDA